MPHIARPYSNPELDAVKAIGVDASIANAREGDPQARRYLLLFAGSEERKARFLEDWKVDLFNLDCHGDVQFD